MSKFRNIKMRYILAVIRRDESQYDILRSKFNYSINTFEFEFIPTDKILMSSFNKFIFQKNEMFPILNNSDINSMINYGRCLVYRQNDGSDVLIIDLEHENNVDVKSMVRDSQINKVI